jgi:catechol 2,3-dioxygenase-like lactoylglutathione lyase family enzyme
MLDTRLEGLTLRVENVQRSIEFYGGKLGFAVEIDKAPHFAMIRVGGPQGGTIGLLPAEPEQGSPSMTPKQRAGIHIELTTDNLDALYQCGQRRFASILSQISAAISAPPHSFLPSAFPGS